ncbi:hypothetical protein EDD18DRAFT_116130 [Armillaria luteobubalina]|uniref:Uncharacterized protein n=1 Tax=Armillaria luteobubalina TaxID=153913 RepID=A0AA39Q8U1_9AGAR|nr:hypothetical protein EDD18DRAFT_116130 [Armillaria luteobubalina]
MADPLEEHPNNRHGRYYSIEPTNVNSESIIYGWTHSVSCRIQLSKKSHRCRTGNIYHNSYSLRHVVSDGFLPDRRSTLNPSDSEALVPFHCPDGGIGTMRSMPDPPFRSPWCFEERVLSPRKLIYATHTHTAVRVPDHPLYNAEKISPSAPPRSPSSSQPRRRKTPGHGTIS